MEHAPSSRPAAGEPPVHGDGRWPRLTRRGAVRTGAALGAAAWLAGTGSGQAASAGSARLRVARRDLAPGRVVGPLRAPVRFDLVGGNVAALHGAGVEVRARTRGGRWSRWVALGDHGDHAPDGRRAAMGDPAWFGASDELQVRARRRPSRDLVLALEGVPAAERRRGALAAARARRAAPRAGTRATAPAIIPRSAWAGSLQPRNAPAMGQVQVAFVHHTVNANAYDPEDSAGIVRAIAQYHMRSNGWSDIGYNFLVDRYGQIFEGRQGGIDRPVVGAQAVGWNSVSTGIAIIGTFENEAPPEAALNAVAALIRWKLSLHGVPTSGSVALVSSGGAGNRWARGAEVAMNRISGHRDGCSTDCPGTTLYGQLATIRAKVGDNAVAPRTTLTIAAPTRVVAYGRTLTLSGRLSVGGAGIAGSEVVVEKRSPSGSWVALGRATTDGAGRWRLPVTWKRSGAVRARAGDVASEAITPPIEPSLSLTSPPKRVDKGARVRVTGRVRGIDHVDVLLRRRSAKGRYGAVWRERLALDGSRMAVRVPVRKTGLHQLTLRVRSGKRTYVSSARYLRAVAR